MNKYRFRLWFEDNWMKYFIGFLLISILVSTIFGAYVFFFRLESFQRDTFVASSPVYLFQGLVTSLTFVFAYWLFLYGGLTRMQAKKVNVEFVDTKFSDVIGLEEAKKEAMEVVSLIRDRARVNKIGGKIIKGILMQGPPGCGKTLLAKAIAAESGVAFLSMSGAEFIEVFVGVGASRIRKLMKRARLLASAHGACIVFIDELDVIGRGRVYNNFGGAEETNSTQNQLLAEMDGVLTGRDNIIFIGATNAPEDKLDPALLRPGRFDRKIYVGKPHLKEREDLFRYYLSKVQFDSNLDIRKLAQRTVQKSPAEIEASVKEAALIATRDNREVVLFKDMSQAFERIDLGIAHRLPMTNREKEMVAIHESGHLVTVYFLQSLTHDVFKATILHRGGTLGHVLPVPKEEQYTMSREELVSDIMVSLAGFLAEKIKYGTTSTGASSDFAHALNRAENMVWAYGMGKSGVIGNYYITQGESIHSSLSEEFKRRLNEETQEILKLAEKETEEFLRKEWKMVELFANLLVEKEELNYDEIEEIFAQHGRARPALSQREAPPQVGSKIEQIDQIDPSESNS